MESNIKPGESLLKWAEYKFSVFLCRLNHQILSNYNWSILKATSHTNIVCFILPFPLNVVFYQKNFSEIISESDCMARIHYLTITESILESF